MACLLETRCFSEYFQTKFFIIPNFYSSSLQSKKYNESTAINCSKVATILQENNLKCTL